MNSTNLTPSIILTEAVDAVVSSFKKHSNENEVDVKEALQEFWSMKEAQGASFPRGCNPQYEVISPSASSAPFFGCYVTLPGGSCFGSFQECETKESAQQSAAKIALLNSVFNEHPSNHITAETIKRMLSDASISFRSSSLSGKNHPLSIFKQMLESHIGESMLYFQESMSIFQLLHWNDSLKAMKQRSCSRDEVIQHYSNRSIDHDMVSQMALDWVSREKAHPLTISNEIKKVKMELLAARMGGRELRFSKEKFSVLSMAKKRINDILLP